MARARATALEAPLAEPRPAGLWRDAFGRLVRNRLAIVGGVVVLLLLVLAAVGPFVTPYPYDETSTAQVREFRGPLVLNESLTLELAQRYVADGTAAAVSFARYFVANPDLVRRFREGRELAAFDRRTLYSPGPCGYIDYPALD